jgi:hypothetical protein
MTASLSPIFTWRTAIAKSDLPPTVRHVALTLSLYMNERGGSAWPSIATLAEDSGLSTRTIMRGIRALERGRYLLCERRPGTSTLYTGIIPTQLTLGDSLTGVTVSPPAQWHPTPDTESPHPSHTVTQSSQEHANTTPEGQSFAGEPAPPPVEKPYRLDNHQRYMLDRILLAVPSWKRSLTYGGVTKLAKHYKGGLTEGLEDLWQRVGDGDVADVVNPYAYLETMCRREGVAS